MSSDIPQAREGLRPYDGPSRFAGLDDADSPIPAMPEGPLGHPDESPSPVKPLVVVVAVGAAVAVALGVYGRLHEPGSIAVSVAGFSGPGYVKAWLTTLAMLLGLVQLVSSLAMYGRLGGWSPSWIAVAHRWSGRAAVLISVPVVVHCLYALGFEYDRARVLMHSLVGCLFYGAFVTKMLVLSRREMPNWAMPVIGGVVFAMLVLLWLTSSLWLFNDQGLHL